MLRHILSQYTFAKNPRFIEYLAHLDKLLP